MEKKICINSVEPGQHCCGIVLYVYKLAVIASADLYTPPVFSINMTHEAHVLVIGVGRRQPSS
jgi:hypothetical protein